MDYFLYDYSPIASLENKEHIIKHEAKIGSQWVNLPYKTTGSSIIYRVTNEKSQVITLPVYAYLGTNVEINHQPVKEQVNANGLVQISGVKGVADIKVSTSYTVTTIKRDQCIWRGFQSCKKSVSYLVCGFRDLFHPVIACIVCCIC
ncbi:hypothetical protein EfmJHP36_05960 [Enterococcus faecium]|nr:hypothetical protein EfmJHP36_05960 [Enterococcus faecium]